MDVYDYVINNLIVNDVPDDDQEAVVRAAVAAGYSEDAARAAVVPDGSTITRRQRLESDDRNQDRIS